MVRHVGDPGLGLAPFGDVDDGDEVAIASLEHHPPSERQHMNLAAVGLEVPPVAARMIGVADLLQRLLVACPFIPWPDLLELHAQERRTAISVMLHRRVVDAQEPGRFGVEHPHRHRVVVEQQSKRGFTPLERRNVGYRQRENVAECGRAQFQVAIVAVDFELVAVAAVDDLQQPLDDLRRTQQVSPGAEPAPQQSGRRHLQQPRRPLIVMNDLEVERPPFGIANRRKRQHALVGRGENRIEQIIGGGPLVDIGADQDAAPA